MRCHALALAFLGVSLLVESKTLAGFENEPKVQQAPTRPYRGIEYEGALVVENGPLSLTTIKTTYGTKFITGETITLTPANSNDLMTFYSAALGIFLDQKLGILAPATSGTISLTGTLPGGKKVVETYAYNAKGLVTVGGVVLGSPGKLAETKFTKLAGLTRLVVRVASVANTGPLHGIVTVPSTSMVGMDEIVYSFKRK